MYKQTYVTVPVYSGSIEVFDFTLGNRTPYVKYATAYDNHDDSRNIKASELNFNHPPDDLMTRGKYQALIHLDAGLTSPEARFVIRMRLGNKGYELKISFSYHWCLKKHTTPSDLPSTLFETRIYQLFRYCQLNEMYLESSTNGSTVLTCLALIICFYLTFHLQRLCFFFSIPSIVL